MIAQTFAWWLAIEVIGLIALPIVFVVFARLPGRGYAFAKPVGLLLGGYLFWLALSLELLPNRPGSIVWAFLPVALVSSYLARRNWPELREALTSRLTFVLAVEAVFFVALFTGGHLKSFIPEIAGTEKPMDFMMLNAAARSQYYPPDDPWLAGFGVSYYYFGYVIQAMLAKLTAVPTAVAFNLGLVSTAALAITAAFGLGFEMARLARRAALWTGLAAGALAVVLIAFMGNLEGVLEYGAANGVLSDEFIERVDIANLESARESDACFLGLDAACITYPTDDSSFWWWWRATRISPDAGSITEFPFFSFLLGDLHPHVMAIPYVLTVAGLALAFWSRHEPLSFEAWRRSPALLLVAAVLLGGLGFLNTWDLPTFGFLLAALVLLRNLALSHSPRPALRDSLGFLAPLIGLAFLLYAPFYLSFSSQASGLEAVADGATRPLHSFLFWGPLALASLSLPVALLLQRPFGYRRGDGFLLAGTPALLLLAWAALLLATEGPDGLGDAITARGWNWLTFAFFAAGLGVCLLALRRQLLPSPASDAEDSEPTGDAAALVPALAMVATGLLLILGAELFYISDVFGSRLNTVFKLSYQAWLLLGAGGAFGLWYVLSSARPRFAGAPALLHGVWAATAGVFVGAALLYSLGATLSRTDGLSASGRTLNGLAQARAANSNELTAIDWLRERAGPDEVLVEAVGGQYSPAGRVSAWTGIPTVLGWPGHEVQWGRDGPMLGRRHEDVDRAYETPSLAEALEILQQYDVTYIFVGSVERATYPAEGLAKFEEGLPEVFSAGEVVIYRTPIVESPAPAASRP